MIPKAGTLIQLANSIQHMSFGNIISITITIIIIIIIIIISELWITKIQFLLAKLVILKSLLGK